MCGGADASCAVDIETDVALVGQEWLSRVEAHANTHLADSQRGLPFLSCDDSISGLREGVEERISLRVDLDSIVALEGFAEQPSVLEERVAVASTEFSWEAR